MTYITSDGEIHYIFSSLSKQYKSEVYLNHKSLHHFDNQNKQRTNYAF